MKHVKSVYGCFDELTILDERSDSLDITDFCNEDGRLGANPEPKKIGLSVGIVNEIRYPPSFHGKFR